MLKQLVKTDAITSFIVHGSLDTDILLGISMRRTQE
jgi:hypothetical protein